MENRTAYLAARRRVAIKLSFFFHLAVYLTVNGFLAFINLSQSGGGLWFIWPLAGWGVGLLLHGWAAFFAAEMSLLKKRMIEAEMKKELSEASPK